MGVNGLFYIGGVVAQEKRGRDVSQNIRFAHWLAAARTAAKLTQADLAEGLGITQATIHYWETEGRQAMEPREIRDLAMRLGVKPVEVADALGYPTRGAVVLKERLSVDELLERGAELSRRLESQVRLWVIETFPVEDEERGHR